MIAMYENYAIQSFLLYLDNKILTRGQAFTNYSGQLYPINQNINGVYTYASPFAQWVSDTSINNANVPTGVFINGNFIPIGTSGLIDINYNKGQAYFNSQQNGTITANYAIKDLNVVIPSVPHIQMLFDTKLELRPKIGQYLTGILDNELTFPAIFIRQYGGYEKPYAIGGQAKTVSQIACYIFANSQFLLDATCSILRDSQFDYIPLLMSGDSPYNIYGGFKNAIPYNYANLTNNRVANGSGILVEKVIITDFSRRIFSQTQNLTPNCFFGMAEFDIFKDRIPQ